MFLLFLYIACVRQNKVCLIQDHGEYTRLHRVQMLETVRRVQDEDQTGGINTPNMSGVSDLYGIVAGGSMFVEDFI